MFIVLSGESNQAEATVDNITLGLQEQAWGSGYSERHRCWVYFKHCKHNKTGLPSTEGVDDTKPGGVTRK